jgi:hypothetical protein
VSQPTPPGAQPPYPYQPQLPNDAQRPCPYCGTFSASKVGFNWWGGALGPRLFHVVQCRQCHKQYNGRSGGKLVKVIIGYQLVALLVLVLVGVALALGR